MRRNLKTKLKLNKTREALLFLFAGLLNFVSRLQISGAIKQTSLHLERKIRNVVSHLFGILHFGERIFVIDNIKYVLSDTRFESFYALSSQCEKNVWRYLRPQGGETFVDVGAHVGKYALRVAKIVGEGGSVIALEPHPENYRALLKNIELNDLENVISLKLAAWDRECRLKLFIGEAAVYHSAKINVGLGYIEVKARTLDQVISDLKLNQVNWIKVDVEGAEIEVLRGLRETLSKYSPKLIAEIRWRNLENFRRIIATNHYTVNPILGEQYPKDKVGYFCCEPSSCFP